MKRLFAHKDSTSFCCQEIFEICKQFIVAFVMQYLCFDVSVDVLYLRHCCGLDDRGYILRQGKRFFTPSKRPDPLWAHPTSKLMCIMYKVVGAVG
jgi:hypothetical protein